jgi:hypothetical protein
MQSFPLLWYVIIVYSIETYYIFILRIIVGFVLGYTVFKTVEGSRYLADPGCNLFLGSIIQASTIVILYKGTFKVAEESDSIRLT